MKQVLRSGGLAAWSIRRPVSVLMLALTILVLGIFSLDKLRINLLPHLIYPEVRVRIFDTGVPAVIMEDKITRQVEEQLAITEDAISVRSSTTEGQSNVDLRFPYGTDINIALRDASTRLDRAKRFLPDTIDPPVIYKRDPMQIPVMEFAVSSSKKDAVELRDWVDYELRNWFINLPGVAAAEVGGGNQREFQILLDQERLANLGINYSDIIQAIQTENQDVPGGRISSSDREISIRTAGKFKDETDLRQLVIKRVVSDGGIKLITLSDIARVIDTHEEARLRVRFNQQPGIKLSIQKQPTANTVAVAEEVKQRLSWLKSQKLIPADINIAAVDDQSIFVRYALKNATTAAVSGSLLAMLVVYLFLGHLGRTLIIGTAIPLAILATFVMMAFADLTLNIMTLGGLALGVGLLVDNTIVMLENISRHTHFTQNKVTAAVDAAAEITSAIVASTSTNLAAILPFLFISGLVGLLFNELILTLSAAMLTSLLVAITVVPALSTTIKSDKTSRIQEITTRVLDAVRHCYQTLLSRSLTNPWKIILGFVLVLIAAIIFFMNLKTDFLPRIDEGQIRISVKSDTGTQLEEMDEAVKILEQLLMQQKEVEKVFTIAGGFIFGRFERESSNRSTMTVQLTRQAVANLGSENWIRKIKKKIKNLNLVGYQINLRVQGVRGIRLSSGEDDLSLRIQGPELSVLTELGSELSKKVTGIPGLRNIQYNYDEVNTEYTVTIDRKRAASIGLNIENIGETIRLAVNGLIVSSIFQNEREYNILLTLPKNELSHHDLFDRLIIGMVNNKVIRLKDVAIVKLTQAPAQILRENQRRIVEVTASIDAGASLSRLEKEIDKRLSDFTLPDGYYLYESETFKIMRENRSKSLILIALALFLVFVVMAIQYESLRNPFIILLSVPFTFIGATLGLLIFQIPVTMPVWLGIIMLAGIVVNNSIVLIEQIEINREKSLPLSAAILDAAGVRLRPILMTTLTTVVGMIPLASGWGEGAEMLQPLAVVIVFGLSFATLVSLLLVPLLYKLFSKPFTNKDLA